MIGTFINVGTVLIGTAIGTVLGSRLPERIRETVMHTLGLFTALLGVASGLAAFRPPLSEAVPRFAVLLVLGSLLFGALIGEAVRIQ